MSVGRVLEVGLRSSASVSPTTFQDLARGLVLLSVSVSLSLLTMPRRVPAEGRVVVSPGWASALALPQRRGRGGRGRGRSLPVALSRETCGS